MKTNNAGELIVPTSGIYYIYLQLRVKVRVADSRAKIKKVGHKIRIKSIIWNSVMERYESLNFDDDYSGLHYLKGGDSIAVAIQNPCPSHNPRFCSVEVFRNRSEKSNFFGAFLVTPATENMV